MSEEKNSEQQKAYHAAIDKLNKDFGKGTIISAKDKPEFRDVISTGSFKLDRATGIGGLARGTVVELRGWESSGKSTLMQHVIANAQKKGLKCVLIDGEHSLDKTYASRIGIDMQELDIINPPHGEAGWQSALTLMKTGGVGVLVVDSQTSLLPKKVIEGEVGDSALGLHARLMSSVIPQIESVADKYNVLVIIISQLREKIGVMFGNPVTTNGGHALKFYAHMIIDVSKTLERKDGTVISNLTKFIVSKNKLAAPFGKAEDVKIVFGQGIDRAQEIFDLAVEMEIIKKSGAWFSYKGDKLGQGETNAKQLLDDNQELYKEIEDLVTEKLNVDECKV